MRYLAVLLAMAASAGSPFGAPVDEAVEAPVPTPQKRPAQPWTSRRPVPMTTVDTAGAGSAAPELREARSEVGRVSPPPVPATTTTHVHRPVKRRIPDVWAALARCESGGRWDIEGAHSGGLQFARSTWEASGGLRFAPTAGRATPAQQIAIATKVQASQGWGAWPSCSRQLGLR